MTQTIGIFPLSGYLGLILAVSYVAGFVWIKPWLETHGHLPYIAKDGSVKRDRTYKYYFDWMIIILFWLAMLMQLVMFESPWRKDIIWDVVFMRLNGGESGAHISTYVLIPIVFIVAYVVLKQDAWLSSAIALFMVGLHETTWYVFYYLQYWADTITTFQTSIQALILFITLMVVFLVKYKRIFTLTIIGNTVYQFLWWKLDAFKVSLSLLTPRLWTDPSSATIWWGDYSTNLIEVCSWFIVFGLMLADIYLMSRNAKVRLNKGDNPIT